MSKKLIYLGCFVMLLGLVGNASAALPSGWTSQDINTTGGSAEESDGVWTVIADGADIYDPPDEFHFVYIPFSGDVDIFVRVVSVGDGSNVWARGGLMIRETLDPDSKYAAMYITGGGGSGTAFMHRPTTNGDTSNATNGVGISAPYWVRLTRVGNTFTGYCSSDGVNWVQQPNTLLRTGHAAGGEEAENPATFEMASDFFVGLCATSHVSGTVRTFIFDNLSPLRPPELASDPDPVDGDTDVLRDMDLNWVEGKFAATHDVNSVSNTHLRAHET